MTRLEIGRRYRARHHTQIRAYQVKWRAENRERVLERSRAWKRANREKCTEYRRRWRVKHSGVDLKRLIEWKSNNLEKLFDINRRSRLKIKYGLSVDQFNQILKSQRRRCAICSVELLTTKSCHVDHNHRTRRFRGILCRRCNLLLGYALDSVSLLTKAIKYLGKHK